MYIVGDVCYAGKMCEGIKVVEAVSLGAGMMKVMFSTGEVRLFDAFQLTGGAFKPLINSDVLKNVELFHGVMTWNEGEIDIAPETVYEMSYPYTDKETMAVCG